MRDSIFTAALGTMIAISGCAVNVADEDTVDQQTAELKGSGGTSKPIGTTKWPNIVLKQGFVVEQVDFVDDGGMSAWGAITIDPGAVARQAGVEAGFISVRSHLGWVVHNLPIHSRPEQTWPDRVVRAGLAAPTFVPPVTTYFDIGTTSPLRATEMLVVFTSQPLSTARDLTKWERASLLSVAVTPTQQTQPKGIAVPPPDGLPPQPPPPPPILAPEPIDPELNVNNWYTVSLPAQDNVNSAQNQCGPVAYANALAYLGSTFGLAVPHPHIRGINGGPGLVGVLDLLSQRPVVDTCNGNPIDYCDTGVQGGMIDGLYLYLANTNLDQAVTLEHQGITPEDFPAACGGSIPQVNPVSNASGDAVTVPWIRSHLENGDAVVLAFNRLANTPNGEVVTSGHVIRIYGYSEINGQDYLMALDDQQQDADNNNNFCVQQDGGLKWETWAVGDSDNDGTLNKGLNDLREITFAMAIGVD